MASLRYGITVPGFHINLNFIIFFSIIYECQLSIWRTCNQLSPLQATVDYLRDNSDIFGIATFARSLSDSRMFRYDLP